MFVSRNHQQNNRISNELTVFSNFHFDELTLFLANEFCCSWHSIARADWHWFLANVEKDSLYLVELVVCRALTKKHYTKAQQS